MKCRIGLLFVSTGKTDTTPLLDDMLVSDIICGLNEAYIHDACIQCELFHTAALFPGEMVVWYKVF